MKTPGENECNCRSFDTQVDVEAEIEVVWVEVVGVEGIVEGIVKEEEEEEEEEEEGEKEEGVLVVLEVVGEVVVGTVVVVRREYAFNDLVRKLS